MRYHICEDPIFYSLKNKITISNKILFNKHCSFFAYSDSENNFDDTKFDNGTKAVPNQIKKLINEYRYK